VASNTANFVLGELVRHGHVRRAYIGVAAQQTVIPRRCGMPRRDAGEWRGRSRSRAGSPAELSGIIVGDIILALDGVAISGADDLIRVLNGDKIGRSCRSRCCAGVSGATRPLRPPSGRSAADRRRVALSSMSGI